jgi:hypothetical protein
MLAGVNQLTDQPRNCRLTTAAVLSSVFDASFRCVRPRLASPQAVSTAMFSTLALLATAVWQADGRPKKGGEYFAVGVGGAVAGRRCDLGIIDDPIRGREDADSDRARARIWAWYADDFKPQLKPSAVQVLITTRRHEDDLAGRLLDRERDSGAPWSCRWIGRGTEKMPAPRIRRELLRNSHRLV